MVFFYTAPVRSNRRWINVVGLLVFLSLVITLWRTFAGGSLAASMYNSNHNPLAFGVSLFETFEQVSPGVSPLQLSGNAEALVFWKATSDTPRPDLVVITPEEVSTMRTAHDTFRAAAEALQVPYQPGTRGIVSTAGSTYLPIFIVSLRMLRRTGCKLPVELFLVSEVEHGPYLCDTLLPSLNARCVYLTNTFGPSAQRLAKFQLKIFSILASSFESLLFLDADSFPVQDPTPLFTSALFKSSGLVTWPDFWASSASKHLSTIQSLPIQPMNLHPSTESGQVLVSKRTHAQALLLAAYYNYYGPSFYYPLLSQGAFGEGDKETFIAGAEAAALTYHMTTAHVDTVGYYENVKENKGYHGVAMLQYDPRHEGADEKPVPLFLHHNYPKLDPVQLFAEDGAAIVAEGGYRRLLGVKDVTVGRFGRDVEEEIWAEVEAVACGLGDKFAYWKVKETTGEVLGTCDMVKEYRRTVFV